MNSTLPSTLQSIDRIFNLCLNYILCFVLKHRLSLSCSLSLALSRAVSVCHAKLKAIQLIWSLLDFKFHCSTPAHSYSFSQFHFNHSANVYHKQIASFRVASAHPSAVASTVIFLLNKIKISLLPSLSDVFLSTWLQALFYTFYIFFIFFFHFGNVFIVPI